MSQKRSYATSCAAAPSKDPRGSSSVAGVDGQHGPRCLARDGLNQPPPALEFGVIPALARNGLSQGEARFSCRARPWVPVSLHWPHERGIHRHPSAPPDGQAIGGYFDASAIRCGDVRVHLPTTCVATCAPTSQQVRASACSRGLARRASTPTCAHAERWSPCASNTPPQRHRFGANGMGRRRRRSSATQNSLFGTSNAS